MEEMVKIPLERYTELIRLETNVNALVGRMDREKFISREEILYSLDTELSVELAMESEETIKQLLNAMEGK